MYLRICRKLCTIRQHFRLCRHRCNDISYLVVCNNCRGQTLMPSQINASHTFKSFANATTADVVNYDQRKIQKANPSGLSMFFNLSCIVNYNLCSQFVVELVNAVKELGNIICQTKLKQGVSPLLSNIRRSFYKK